MQNKIIKIKRCTAEEIAACQNIYSKRKWGDQSVCEQLRPIDCPHLLCDGEPCLAGTLIDTNAEEVEFPCSTCKKPTIEEKEESNKRFHDDLDV
jgi:hypothetical protein